MSKMGMKAKCESLLLCSKKPVNLDANNQSAKYPFFSFGSATQPLPFLCLALPKLIPVDFEGNCHPPFPLIALGKKRAFAQTEGRGLGGEAASASGGAASTHSAGCHPRSRGERNRPSTLLFRLSVDAK